MKNKILLSEFDYGRTPFYACQYDQRFSYCLYVPRNYDENKKYPLTVVIHGTERAAQEYRNKFIDFAKSTNTIILAPLFPCGIIEPFDLDNYKFIKFHNIRFDTVLLSMIDEVASRYSIIREKFLLHGFSGGGQFAHRFLYLHPDRILGISIGAPGVITYLDNSKAWPNGISDFEKQFGKTVDMNELKKVHIQMVVGSEDTEDLGNNPYGNTRIERLKALRDSFKHANISVQYDEVPGAAHEGFKILPPVKKFFINILQNE